MDSKLLHQFLRDNSEDEYSKRLCWSAFTINDSYQSRRHRDSGNVGPSAIVAVGNFQNGYLRYWAQDNWQLVTFLAKDWKWSETSKERGIFAFDGGQERHEKKHTKKLEMTLRKVQRKDGKVIFRPAVTGDDAPAAEDYTPEGALSAAAKKQMDEAPVIEFEVRFGPHVGVARFEPVKFDTVKSTRKGSTSRDSFEVSYAKYTDLLARTEDCEAEGALTLGLLTRDGKVEETVVLEVIGGEEPSLWPTTRKGAEELDFITGKRLVTKTSPKTLTVELESNVLTIHLNKVDYVFEL